MYTRPRGPGTRPETAPELAVGATRSPAVDSRADGTPPEPEQHGVADAPEPLVADRRVSRAEWRYLAVLMAVGGVLFAVAVGLRMLHGEPSGDEPAYLVISQTLQKYHSVDVMLDYNHHDYRSFYSGTLAPHVATAPNGRPEPLHNIGGPLIWLIPFMLFGRLGALGVMAAVSLLIVGNVYFFLRERGIEPRYSFLVALLMTAASPVYTYASMSFVEPMGALLILYAMRVLLAPRLSAGRLLAAVVGLAVLPWIHSRFLMFTAIIAALFLFRIFRETGRTSWRPYLLLVVPLAVSLTGIEVFNQIFWGTLNPASNESTAGNGPFQIDPAVGLIGILFDRQVGLVTNYPLFVLVLPGVLLSVNRARWWMQGTMAAVMVPYILLVSTFAFWWAGYSPPARYIMVIVPLLAYYIAVVLQRLKSILMISAVVAVGLATYALSLYTDIHPRQRFGGWLADQGNHNYGMDRLSHLLGIGFVRYVPSAFEAGQHPLFLAWLAVATVVGLLIWVWARLRPPLPGGDWAPARR